MHIKPNIKKAGLLFIIALALIMTTLFWKNNVILTDNGDFGRVTRLCSLEKDAGGKISIVLKGDTFSENIKNILFTPEDVSTYPSSQIFFVRISVAVNYAINTVTGAQPNNYNIFYLGAFMSVLYALAISFFLSQFKIKNKYLKILFCAASLVILCDIGYVSYFNSLYAEGLQHILFIFLLGFFMIILKRNFTVSELIAFTVTLIFYGQSKFFNIPIAILLGILSVILSMRHGFYKKVLISSISSLLICVVFLFNTMNSMPEWISNETNYNAVFYGILKNCSDDEARDYLENDLSLNPDLYVMKNTHHYVSNFSEIDAAFNTNDAKGISKIKLLSFYLRHPLITVEKAFDTAEHSGVIRNIFFMNENYMQDSLRLKAWSKTRENTGFDTVLLNLAIILMVIAASVIFMRKKQFPVYAVITAPMLLLMIFGYAYIVPYISNGEADLAKHMYTFIELVDASLIFLFAAVLNSNRKVKIAAAAAVLAVIIISSIPRSAETVSFGGYEWYVIEENSEYKTLISKDTVATQKFHNTNDNNYSESDIHKWLNTEFIGKFSEKERNCMYLKEEKIPLSYKYAAEATSGNRDFYCSAFPKRVCANSDTAYSCRVSGYAFLPTAEHISKIANGRGKVTLKDRYWLSTPYFNSPEKSRYVNPDGLVYSDFTSTEYGIRPVIYIKSDAE